MGAAARSYDPNAVDSHHQRVNIGDGYLLGLAETARAAGEREVGIGGLAQCTCIDSACGLTRDGRGCWRCIDG
ncbi:hypothetical protein I553_2693 [Mycobacterium xenopi 4042]|uniref:Uncharacterized protein n=1 Tax=Mycobacterium xenopi 4042 TaxID=1299334 RepID=X8CKK8_MYCXE|nr:hypothetical protein I552_4052 [Mycobacterium xenopi 3993]EUA56361.1 hypothetical protein I553_2693 [Mycobacterium xenopi 4042]